MKVLKFAFIAVFLTSCVGLKSPETEQIVFNNPLALQRADPHVTRTPDGTYYFIATVPEYDRIELRKANSI
ncbi:MAG TPA: hypothetical protein VK833_02055, partial [Gillisia sp.]|nr:hypothetical protein [Gillisia sp.]